jgi:iron complex transport system substrate-binding protein
MIGELGHHESMEQLRIVTLMASATELVCALGLRDSLVGRSHECDFPESVAGLPVCTRPRFDTAGNSAEIDRQVKSLRQQSLLQDALGLYEVFPEKLRELQPTHIVTQTQCEVCAVSLKDLEHALAQQAGCQPHIVSLHPNSLADFWGDLCRLASELGITDFGIHLIAELQERMNLIEARARACETRPTVVNIEWADPLMAAGNWMPELIAAAGGRDLLGAPGAHSPWIKFEEIAAADPEVIIVSPCGFGIARARQDLPILGATPGWSRLRAVKNDNVYIVDGNQYFHRPGPRLVESLEILAEILHPEAFQFGHEEKGWSRARAPKF